MRYMAYVFHWPPSELGELTADDVIYWAKQLEALGEDIKKGGKG